MDQFENVQQAPLTDEQRAVVLDIKKLINVLTVRDQTTYEKSKAQPYGREYTPMGTDEIRGTPRLDTTIRHKRVIELHFRDSDLFEGGVPIGATYIYRRTQASDMGPDSSYRFVGCKYDIIQDEMNRVRALARGTRWMTQAERLADERRKNRARARVAEEALTPGESMADRIAAGVSQGIAAALSKQQTAAPVATEEPPKRRGGRKPKEAEAPAPFDDPDLAGLESE